MKGYSLFDYDARVLTRRYDDPLELIWYATAKRLGLTIKRNPSVFAMTDGTGLLELATRDTLDADDNAAQMIVHEICHWITNGVETFTDRDWGFEVVDTVDWREFPGIRVQAALAERYGLRDFLAPTSGFRRYYDQIPADVLEPIDDSPEEARTVERARLALRAADFEPWGDIVREALMATAALRAAVTPFLAHYQSDGEGPDLPSLWARLE